MEDSHTLKELTKRAHTIKQALLASIATLPAKIKALLALALIVFIATSFGILVKINSAFMVEVPEHSGSLTEGILNFPRFINPVLAKSDADRDMSALVYSGLLRATPEGDLMPDLAESYNVSPDGLTYTFILKTGAVWHDGEPITSADIAFTIDEVRNPHLAIKSPRRASWEGVEVSTPDAQTVVFTLKQPYAPFLENATMGIIPKHIWKNVPDAEFDVSYYNIEPIGSGPYRIKKVVRDSNKGLPSYYDLVAFQRFAGGEPYITDLRIMFFGNNKELSAAYTDGIIDQMHGLDPEQARTLKASGGHITESPLPRVFAIYFNQTQQPIFADKAVRQVLDMTLDRTRIVSDVLGGYGRPIDGPLPIPPSGMSTSDMATGTLVEHISAAQTILEQAGWTQNPSTHIYEKINKKNKKLPTTILHFDISMPDVPELRQIAEIMKHDWELLGAQVTLKVFDPSTFTTDILSPRKYDALFYGQIIGRVPDPYPYWHSSQKNAPGLNVAMYGSKTADKLLEDIRKENDATKRNDLLQKFVSTINTDIPALFVYSPDFLYVTARDVQNMHTGLITTESERFLNIADWYVDSERVWKWFAERMTQRKN